MTIMKFGNSRALSKKNYGWVFLLTNEEEKKLAKDVLYSWS